METPYGRLIEDPQILDGDPPCFLVGDPTFSLETPYFHWRPHIFIEDPIFLGDPIFSLETPRFSIETAIFSLWAPYFI